jgi:hypothetical protein
MVSWHVLELDKDAELDETKLVGYALLGVCVIPYRRLLKSSFSHKSNVPTSSMGASR